jgi:hypothetical protein
VASTSPFNLLEGVDALAPSDPFGMHVHYAVRAHPGWLRALSVSHRALGFYGAFVWARMVLSIPKRRLPAPGNATTTVAKPFALPTTTTHTLPPAANALPVG